MPLALAKRSHLVSGLATGRGFSRGSNVLDAGRETVGPDVDGMRGRFHRVDMREAVDVRVRARRWGSRLLLD